MSCGRACPSHKTQNSITVGAKLYTTELFVINPWSTDQAERGNPWHLNLPGIHLLTEPCLGPQYLGEHFHGPHTTVWNTKPLVTSQQNSFSPIPYIYIYISQYYGRWCPSETGSHIICRHDMNSMAPSRYDNNFKRVISIHVTDKLSMWMPQNMMVSKHRSR